MRSQSHFCQAALMGCLRSGVWLASLACALSLPTQSLADDALTPSTNASSKLRSCEDGWLDLSRFIDEAYGFVPLVVSLTEPAVGYGAAGGWAFIDELARKCGVHMGVDVAFGPDAPVIYVQFGSAWMRP
jgi:hypothetical protein